MNNSPNMEPDSDSDSDSEGKAPNSHSDSNPNLQTSELKEPQYPDYAHLFNIRRPFRTLEEAKDHVKNIGKDNNMFLRIGTSKPNRVYMDCERSGKYRKTIKNPDAVRRRGTATKKLECPFQVRLKKLLDGFWLVRSTKGRHNHELSCHGNWSTTKKKLKEKNKVDLNKEDTEDGNVDNAGKPSLRDEFNKTVRDFMETATEADMKWFQQCMSERLTGEQGGMNEPMVTEHRGGSQSATVERHVNNQEMQKTLSGFKIIGQNSGDGCNDEHNDHRGGHESSFLYAHEMPQHFLSFIRCHYPCDSDGNCGYRAISTAVYRHQREWKRVRRELIGEMENFSAIHSAHIGDHYQHIRERLDWFVDELAPPSKWYDVTSMGLLTATLYQRVVVCFSIFGSSTYLPLQSRPESLVPPPPKDTIYLGHVDGGRHWVLLRCAPFCPLPPLDPQWQYCASMNVLHWAAHFRERMDAWIAYANENWL